MAYNPFRNFGLKVLALAIAGLLWFTMAGEHVVERLVSVPLEMQNRPERLELVSNPPDEVDVHLRGSSGLLSRLQPGDVVAILDLEQARPGSRLFHLRTDQVRSPFGISVSQVIPQTIALAFEHGESAVVPISPDIDGEPAPGYVVGRVTVSPSSVEVVGPSSDVHALRDATTEPISVDGATSRIEETVTVGVEDSAVRLREPLRVTVGIDILPAPIERTFPAVGIEARNTPARTRAVPMPAQVSVSVRGGRDAVPSLDGSQVVAYVDLAGLRPGRYNLPVRVEPSRIFGVTRIEPAVVEVTIK